MMGEKKKIVLFWALVFVGILLVLSQRGYSDGDDAYFYQYTHEMGLFSYLSWRYETWVGRLAAETLVYVTFRLGLWFWRVINALMLIAIPIGLLSLAEKAAGRKQGEAQTLAPSIAAVLGYLLMGAMTLGYSAIWVNGSIFYTWTFACGIWALLPLAELVFLPGREAWPQKERGIRFCTRDILPWKFLGTIPCAVIASMSIEQIGAVLLAFEILGMLYCALVQRRVNVWMLIQTALTAFCFAVLFLAPGNDIRIATEIATWMPAYETMSFGQHIFLTTQWLLSSFANENKLFLCGIWIAGIFLLLKKQKKSNILIGLTALFLAAGLLPFIGVTLLSDMGLHLTDITVPIEHIPQLKELTWQNRTAMLWWLAALCFTGILLWRAVDEGQALKVKITVLLVYLAGIASEAILFFSPTIYASGARVYYLTDLLYLFLILCMSFWMEQRARNVFYGILVFLGLFHLLFQLPLFLSQL
ncbi:MAG: DUF6056 family protein [Roseburia sp.]